MGEHGIDENEIERLVAKREPVLGGRNASLRVIVSVIDVNHAEPKVWAFRSDSTLTPTNPYGPYIEPFVPPSLAKILRHRSRQPTYSAAYLKDVLARSKGSEFDTISKLLLA
jgi:hypothetical protein